MKVFDSFGDNLTIPVASLTFPSHTGALPLSGDVCLCGRIAGIANADGVTGGSVVVSTRGVYNVPVTSVDGAIAIGATLYANATTAIVSDDPDSSVAIPFGIALDAVASSTHTIRVKLFGQTFAAFGT
jgi:predicted RecA/RadA family phage recombinase